MARWWRNRCTSCWTESAATRSTSAPSRSGLADSTHGAPGLAGAASTSARMPRGRLGEERADEEQGADGAEAPHPLLERAVHRIQEPGLVEVRQDPERAAAPGEAPALTARGEHLPEGERGPRREPHLGGLGVARAGEAGRRVGREDEGPLLGHPGHRVGDAAARGAEDAGGPLRRDEGAGAGPHHDVELEPVSVDQPATEGAGVGPGRGAVVARGEEPERALRVGGLHRRPRPGLPEGKVAPSHERLVAQVRPRGACGPAPDPAPGCGPGGQSLPGRGRRSARPARGRNRGTAPPG